MDLDTIPSRRYSTILFRYVAVEFFVPLICCIGGLLTLFLIADIFDVLQDFLDADNATAFTALQYLFMRLPVNLGSYVLPMSVLLSSCFMMNRLARYHEDTAFRSAGLSMMAWCAPVWLIAAALAVTTFLLGEEAVPRFSRRSEQMLDAATGSENWLAEKRSALAFHNGRDRRDWFCDRFVSNAHQEGVQIKQFRPDGTPDWELRAERSAYVDGSWFFYRAVLTRFDSTGALPEGPEKHFAEYVRRDFTETPDQLLNSLRPAETLSIEEIRKVMHSNPNLPALERNAFLSMIWFRYSFPLSCLIGAMLGVSLSANVERGGFFRGFAMAVGLMVLYCMCCEFFLYSGKSNSFPPFVAGCIPTLVFFGWGCLGVYRKR